MRELTEHIVEGDSVNHQLTVEVLDEPGQGGACHHYRIAVPMDFPSGGWGSSFTNIRFQNGPIKEWGLNGITQETLLAIVIDRLRGFQSGPFACRNNAFALAKIEEALECLQDRTRERIKRSVEGTNVR